MKQVIQGREYYGKKISIFATGYSIKKWGEEFLF